ncbi:MAG: lysyl-tRNA synthetase class 2 [Candidatus Promineifilaceae bacterium]|jgi:elongation factor P--(R)-beta-lysine ligase
MNASHLATRSRLLFEIRSWFQAHDFIETETPVRVAAPPPEVHIDAFQLTDGTYLRPSPELHLKRLVAAGVPRVYEIGPCFRHGERGSLHNPEYTMLEWYRAGCDYRGVLADCQALLRDVVAKVTGATTLSFGEHRIDLAADWLEVRVQDVFLAHAGWDPVAHYDEDRFDADLVAKVLPALSVDVPVVLIDYPVEAAALARCSESEPPVAQRWELLIGGMELANAYSELCDAHEQRQRFELWNQKRQLSGRDSYPLDDDFLGALAAGLPDCGGIALGVDRLLMAVCGVACIDEVRPFCWNPSEIT